LSADQGVGETLWYCSLRWAYCTNPWWQMSMEHWWDVQ